jgi:ATPase family protein associated with various cellular activities (AAA)
VSEPTKVELRHDVQLDSIVYGVFVSRVAQEGLRFAHREGWRTVAEEPDLGEPLMRISHERGATTLFELDGTLLLFGFSHGHVFAAAASTEKQPVDDLFGRLRDLLPPPDPSSKHEVPVTFWTYGLQGPQQSWRSIAVPSWEEIEANYRESTRAPLASIMRDFRPAHGGQLILWHGPAGTGKTFALRALAWAWRDWCELSYIVDPDAFFGQHADYLMSVLLEDGEGMTMRRMQSRDWTSYSVLAGVGMSFHAEAEEDEEEQEPPWRVLILEDAGELIQADARAAAGQGLSRFLNVVDGLIGQGLRVLVLVTTNEEVRRLHPAVARPGRCAANIEFGPLPAPEAATWLEEHGIREPVSGTVSLASLYARLEGRDADEVRLVGFGDP